MSLQNKCEITGSVIGSIEWEAEPNCKCDYCWNPIVAATTPPQPLQPGDKVLVEAKYRQPFMGHGEVLFHLPDGNHACIVVQQSSIRPFPQEEE